MISKLLFILFAGPLFSQECTYTLQHAPVGSIIVFRNGTALEESDYTRTGSGGLRTVAITRFSDGDRMMFYYSYQASSAKVYQPTKEYHTCTGNQNAVVITPGTEQTAIASQVIKFSANATVKWSMGAGSLGSIDSSGRYTAPATVPVFHPVGGCTIMSGNSIYNHRIDTLAVSPESAGIISRISQVGPQWTGPFPVTTITNTAYPPRDFSFFYAGITVPGFMVPSNAHTDPTNPDFGIESGWFSWDTSGDRHAIQIVRPTCEIQELYNYYPAGTMTADPGCGWSREFCAKVTAQGGGIYPATSTTTSAGIDAAGLGALPLILSYAEVLAGEIKHMLRMTVGGGGCVFWPAQSGSICTSPVTNSPYGAVYRLKASKLAELIAGGLNFIETVLATQLNHYGLMNTDVGYGWQISVVDEWKPPSFGAASTHLHDLLKATDFEIVDQSPLMVAPHSLDTTDTAEIVIATEPATGQKAQVRVNLQGSAIGRDHVSETFIAGAPALQLSAWVTGSTNTSITWSISPAVGTLSASGLYTPPASVDALTTATVTATSAANPALSTTIGISILPAGKPLRFRCGGTSDYTDTSGNVWLGDQVPGRPLLANLYSGAYYDHTAYGIHWEDAGNQDLYNHQCSTNGKDPGFRLHVPPGDYTVGILVASSDGSVLGRDHSIYDVNGAGFSSPLVDRDTVVDVGGGFKTHVYEIPVTVPPGTGDLWMQQRRHGLAPDQIDYKDDFRTIYHSNGMFPEFVGMIVTPKPLLQ